MLNWFLPLGKFATLFSWFWAFFTLWFYGPVYDTVRFQTLYYTYPRPTPRFVDGFLPHNGNFRVCAFLVRCQLRILLSCTNGAAFPLLPPHTYPTRFRSPSFYLTAFHGSHAFHATSTPLLTTYAAPPAAAPALPLLDLLPLPFRYQSLCIFCTVPCSRACLCAVLPASPLSCLYIRAVAAPYMASAFQPSVC